MNAEKKRPERPGLSRRVVPPVVTKRRRPGIPADRATGVRALCAIILPRGFIDLPCVSRRPRGLAQSSTFPWDTGLRTVEISSCGGMVAAARSALDKGVGFAERGFPPCPAGSRQWALHFQRFGVGDLCVARSGSEPYPLHRPGCSLRRRNVLDRGFTSWIPSIGRLVVSHGSLPTGGSFDPRHGGFERRVLDRLVFEWLAEWKIPCAWAIGGGYLGPGLDRPGLVALHRTTIELAAS